MKRNFFYLAMVLGALFLAVSCANNRGAVYETEGEDDVEGEEEWLPVSSWEVIGNWEGDLLVPILEDNARGFPASKIGVVVTFTYDGGEQAVQGILFDFNLFLDDLLKTYSDKNMTSARLWDQFFARNFSDEIYTRKDYTVAIQIKKSVYSKRIFGDDFFFMNQNGIQLKNVIPGGLLEPFGVPGDIEVILNKKKN
ncbi:MAG: hypothetical protein LBT16_02050 [Treponema sp.]|jgi:hypothetical protein|nr:hypothetical protein [Treponema sp.]